MAKENLKDVPIEVLKATAKSLSQKSFWTFCRFMLPSIYKDGRWHLKELCDKLQDFVENKLINDSGKPWERLIINMPPRHGKTLTVELLCAWMLGKNKANTIATACYNEALSGRFGKSVRNFISEQQAHENKICYADISTNSFSSASKISSMIAPYRTPKNFSTMPTIRTSATAISAEIR